MCQFRLQNGRRGKQQTQPATQDIGFQDDGSRAADGAAQTKPGGGRYSDAMRTATKLAQISTLVAKKSAVEDILGAYNVYVSDSECLPFYFNRRAAVKLSTDGVFSNNSVAPSLAYITFDKIQSLRKKHVYMPPYKRVNEIVNAPGLRVRQKRLDSLEPQNPAEDPYIVAILIALAQEQRRRRQQQEGSQGASAKIKTKDQTSHVDADTTLGVAKSRTDLSCSLSAEQMAWNKANFFKVCSAQS
ncbi:hypothetical protein N7524_010999 [Penicillium chrysogenum]|nr:hypothetical protein N7524_010999 [Penicillium chrysogenum]